MQGAPAFADVSEALHIVLQFFFDFAKLADGDIELVTVITNAACIRYQLLGMTTQYIGLEMPVFHTSRVYQKHN